MKVEYKVPAHGGALMYCPHCGKEMEQFKDTGIKYCLRCQRGFGIFTGSSTGNIGVYQMTEIEMIAGKMERIENDDR